MRENEKPPLHDQIARELQLSATAHWKLGDPPREGHYLVTVKTDEGPPFVRLERWDGRCWATLGGYVTALAWDYLPQAYLPQG